MFNNAIAIASRLYFQKEIVINVFKKIQTITENVSTQKKPHLFV